MANEAGQGGDVSMSVSEEVIAYWRRTGVLLNPPATPEQIGAFEAAHGVRLPEPLRQLLLFANGSDMDDHGYRFLSLQEYAIETSRWRWDDGLSSTVLVFMDYFCWNYCFGVEMGEPGNGQVYLLVDAEGGPPKLSESFEEFLGLYLADSDRLYGG
jgi:hypothetical protein